MGELFNRQGLKGREIARRLKRYDNSTRTSVGERTCIKKFCELNHPESDKYEMYEMAHLTLHSPDPPSAVGKRRDSSQPWLW